MFVTVREDAFGDDYVFKFCWGGGNVLGSVTATTEIGGSVGLSQLIYGTESWQLSVSAVLIV